jgi:tRNA dimethylallyltransferase
VDVNPVICLMGATATGKTNLAIELMQRLPIEIISVDSAMIYQDMDIGTAKPSSEILQQAPHHLIDIRDPKQSYSAGEFREDALSIIEHILKKQRVPLLVGGTMLYFQVLQHGIAALPKANPVIRQQLQQELTKQGLEKLYLRLQQLDPHAAQRIHANDPQRLVRALEIIAITGKTLTEIQQNQTTIPLPYQFINIALIPSDKSHHDHLIENRFHAMLKQGFVAEVETLFKRDDLNTNLPAIRTVGYRQIWNYLGGKLTYAEMQERSIIATRQLAKRQMTWLRAWKNLCFLTAGEKNNCNKFVDLMKNFL